MNPIDLEAFQRLHRGPDGAKLKVDGDLGPKTQWAMDLAALPAWRSKIVLMGLSWVDLTEVTPNSSPEIDQWLAACGVQPGNPWCAAFASLCLRAAGFECREASVHRLAAKYPETLCPLPGDLCILRRSDGTGHVDLVTGVSPERVSVVGGNVGNAVRAGLRAREGRTFHRVGESGIPEAVAKLPLLGGETR